MKNRVISILVIVLSLVVFTVLFYQQEVPTSVSFEGQFFMLMGILSLILFAWVFFLATKIKLIDYMFHGLDKSYKIHKYLGMVAVFFALIHVGYLKLGENIGISGFGERLGKSHSLAELGGASMVLFLGLIFLAIVLSKFSDIVAKYVPYVTDYEVWKYLHKLFIIPYIFGLFHYYGASAYPLFNLSAFTIYINVFTIIGVVSGIYVLGFYDLVAYKHLYTIIEINQHANIVEIVAKPKSKKLKYHAGQFGFFKFKNGGKYLPSHPFSISSSPNSQFLTVTIKNLGVHTNKIINSVKVGDDFKVSSAHGMFNYKKGLTNQLWIAAGVGVTPFHSFYFDLEDQNYHINFIYSFFNKSGSIYTDSFLKKNNINTFLHESCELGNLDINKIKTIVQSDELMDVYICGPTSMRKDIIRQLKDSNLKIRKISFEYFDFR